MPIYEYQCEACGHYLEALQQLSDSPLKKCPDCGKSKLRRLLSAPMFLLKGSGWYETDFKSDKEIKRNLADRPDKEETRTESPGALEKESKTEAKTDAKAPPKEEPKSAPSERPTTVARTKTLRKLTPARSGQKKARGRRA